MVSLGWSSHLQILPLFSGCIHRPICKAAFTFISIDSAFSHLAQEPLKFKPVASDFNTPKVGRNSITVTHYSFVSIPYIRTRGWMQQVTKPTRNNYTLHLIINFGLLLRTTNALRHLSATEHRIFTRNFPTHVFGNAMETSVHTPVKMGLFFMRCLVR